MAIYCMQCGKELPDDANFCLKCGKPIGNAVKPAPQSEQQWEYCEIVCEHSGFFGGKSYFLAKAIGAKGVYEAGRSTTPFGIYPSGPDGGYSPAGTGGKYQSALDEVLAALSAKGWQPVGRDTEYWWKYKFRRLVK